MAGWYGAEVIWRDYEQHPDDCGFVPTNHAIRKIEETEKIDIVVTLLPTSPLRKPADLDAMIRIFVKEEVTTTVSMVTRRDEIVLMEEVSDNTAVYSDVMNKTGKYLDLSGGTGICDPQWYLDLYVGMPQTNKELEAHSTDFHPETAPVYVYIAEAWQIFDIDYIKDFELCEALMRMMILGDCKRAEVYVKYWGSK